MTAQGRDLEFGVRHRADGRLATVRAKTSPNCRGIEVGPDRNQDHPYQSRFLDSWTLISVLAAKTERVRLFPSIDNKRLSIRELQTYSNRRHRPRGSK